MSFELRSCIVLSSTEFSANDASWWDNSAVSYLGWKPKDNAAAFRAKVKAAAAPSGKEGIAALYQGGEYVDYPIYDD